MPAPLPDTQCAAVITRLTPSPASSTDAEQLWLFPDEPRNSGPAAATPDGSRRTGVTAAAAWAAGWATGRAGVASVVGSGSGVGAEVEAAGAARSAVRSAPEPAPVPAPNRGGTEPMVSASRARVIVDRCRAAQRDRGTECRRLMLLRGTRGRMPTLTSVPGNGMYSRLDRSSEPVGRLLQ